MLTFTSLLEAKIKKSLVRTFPEAPGEQAFVNRHKQEDVLKDYRPDDDDDAFTGGNVAVFDRAKNRFGNDMNKSIIKYESEDINEGALKNLKRFTRRFGKNFNTQIGDIKKDLSNPTGESHDTLREKYKRKDNIDKIRKSKANESEELLEKSHKPGTRHIFINGKWVGTTAFAKNNKEALKRYISVHPDIHSSQVKVASESIDEGNNFKNLKDTNFKKGELVHAGLATKGGAGFIGRVQKIDGDHLHLNLGMSKFGDRIVKAHKSLCTKEMNENEFPMITRVLEGRLPNLGKILRAQDSKKRKEAFKEREKKRKEEESKNKKVEESLGRDRQSDFADSKGKMKQTDIIDKKSDKKDKVKDFINKIRKKK